MADLILCRSDAGDGGWSLHAPGSTDEAIANGDAPALAVGTAYRDGDGWNRPNAADERLAWSEIGPNSTSHIGIEIVAGARSVDDADKERAREAAAAELNRAEVFAVTAEAEYRRQWAEYDDEDRMTGLALVWIDARNAADLALTEGWADPNGASCTIYA